MTTETIEDKIEKLLRVADGTANENESTVALQMAQKLADLHNLDLGVIGKSGSRKDEKVSKGLYQYQRTLYGAIGQINHCRVWITKGLHRGSKYETRLLGSKMNVTMTKRTCDYIEDVVNRMVRENMDHVHYFSKEAHIYREGVIDRLVNRVRERREQEEAERRREKAEQEARAKHPGAATENAIVLISDVAREEEKANYDYINGEGAWDAYQARIEKFRRDREQAAKELAAWEAANPEAVAAKEAERQKAMEAERKREERNARNRERARQRRIDEHGYDPQDYRGAKTKYDHDAYWQGRSDGESVNLDDQITREKRKAIG